MHKFLNMQAIAGVKIIRDHSIAISLDDIWYMFIMGRYEYSKDVDTFINSLSHKDLSMSHISKIYLQFCHTSH